MYLMGALLEGVALRLAGPEGTFFSTSNIILALALIGNSIGRFLGPPSARAILGTEAGQTTYSLLQLMISLVALMLIELGVATELHKMDTNSEENDLHKGKDETDISRAAEGAAEPATEPAAEPAPKGANE
jgi:hypothetical protein